jgi:hypothetical protein
MSAAAITPKSVLDASRAFLRTHELGQLAKLLPDPVNLREPGAGRFYQAAAEGFDSAFLFPSAGAQRTHFDEILKQTAITPVFGLDKSDQYTQPVIADVQSLRIADPLNRPFGPYVLFYRSGPLPRETRDKKASDSRVFFRSMAWNGLTIPEYMILQRILCEKNRDHRFDVYSPDVARSQWMWLLDSKTESGVIMAFWNPVRSRIEIGVSKEDAANARRGAQPSIVIETV